MGIMGSNHYHGSVAADSGCGDHLGLSHASDFLVERILYGEKAQ